MTLELPLVCYTQVLHACMHDIQMAKAMTYYLRFIDELYHAIENRFDSRLVIFKVVRILKNNHSYLYDHEKLLFQLCHLYIHL
jgi:hypothetical protein